MDNFTIKDYKDMIEINAVNQIYESAIFHIQDVITNANIVTKRQKFDEIDKIIKAVWEVFSD